MTGNEQIALETNALNDDIPASKIEKKEISQDTVNSLTLKEDEEPSEQPPKDNNHEEVEEITEEGTVNSLELKSSGNPLAQEFFEDKNPFEAEKCRIEILNLPLGYDNQDELMDIFSKYGKVLNIEFKTLKCVHGFIQFESQPEMLAALKAEDRREMPGGFKLNLVDEFKRNEERKSIKNATIVPEKKRNIDNTKRNVRERDRSSKQKSSRKRSLSPAPTYSRKDSIPKRQSSRGPFDILIIGLGDVLNSFVESVEDKCLEMRFRPDISYLDYRDDVKGRIVAFQQAATMGCYAVLFCERKREDSRNVSMQLFSIQGTRGMYHLCFKSTSHHSNLTMLTQDYENLSQSEAFSMLKKERETRQSVQTMLPQAMNPPQPIIPVQNPLMMALGGQSLDPQRLLALAGNLPQTAAFPQAPYPVQPYPNYQQPFPQLPQGQFTYPTNPIPTQNVGNLLSQLSSVQDMLKRATNQGQGR